MFDGEEKTEVVSDLQKSPVWRLNAGLVDTVEVKVRPVLLGGGIPLLPPPARQANLKLTAHEVSRMGIVALRYAVE
jgi:hypothetical protein